MTRRRTKVPEPVCKLAVFDESGMLVEQTFRLKDESDVEVETQLHLGAEPLPLAGVSLTSAHSLLEVAEAPQDLIDRLMQMLAEVHALVHIRIEAANQKRRDRRDRGVSDDWPKHDDSGDLPF